ncbi:putative bifunctional diguanylate cyclase/phosphodiesterase [Planosporangium sp. 12N6]|uniref:putative bifunctional diguanylate cyclase/phosphodiesterase n=1 Tax=Planosporangium spinosum TaxID=3402278 RepID=UPI003CEA1026
MGESTAFTGLTDRPGAPGAGRAVARRQRPWWRRYLLVGLVIMAVAPTLPETVRQCLYGAVGASALATLIIGARWHRPTFPRPWRLFTAGVAVSLAAVLWWAVEMILRGQIGFPSPGDILFVSAYPLITVALATWVRRDRSRPGYESVVDAALVVSGLFALSWTFVMAPMVAQWSVIGSRVVMYLVYTGADLLIVAMAVRLIFSARIRTPSYLLMVMAAFTMLVADCVYYILTAHHNGALGSSLAAPLYILTYLFLGAAALHPSMAWSTGMIERSQPIASPLRMALYALLSLVAPAASIGIVVVRGAGSPSGALVMPMVFAATTAVLLVVRLGLLARVAHRRAADLDSHALALSAALREQQALREELTHRALHDSLTGLGNRALLHERLKAVTGRHALVLLDLDGFKDVNDTYGHPVGDVLLVEVAQRLRSAVTDGVLVRLGGDEFALVLDGVGPAGVQAVAEAMVETLREPFVAGDRETALTGSVGVLLTDGPLPEGEALRRADLALYAAKEAGKNRVEWYDPALAVERDRRTRLVADLRRALADEEFTVHYQPVVELATGTITSVEALVRWMPPGRPPVSPAEFIPTAEESGLINQLGAWVLCRALRDARSWYEQYGVSVGVNVSARQLGEPGLAEMILGELAAQRLPGSALVVELTESILIADGGAESVAVLEILDRLRAHGVRIAVDDFGTGYSSMAYLRTLPVDILKIDRAFVQESAGGTDPAAFLRAMVQMGRSLRLRTIAEAVETPAQATRLRQVHCTLAQGYYFSRPIAAEELDALLARTGGRFDVAATAAAAA